MRYVELDRLVCAGAINGQFRQLLLEDPLRAISNGYYSESFSLTDEELDMVTSLRVREFQEFAKQVHLWIEGRRNGDGPYGGNGNGNGNGLWQDPFHW
ncbi:MAG: hypothetical protein ACE5NP_10555 [Anaerolineae bacterium]